MLKLDSLISFFQDCILQRNVGNVSKFVVCRLYQKKTRKNMQKESGTFEKKRSGNKELHVRHNSSVNQPYRAVRLHKIKMEICLGSCP